MMFFDFLNAKNTNLIHSKSMIKGTSKAKKAAIDSKKFGAIATFYLIGLIIMLASIPWPFRNLGGAWF